MNKENADGIRELIENLKQEAVEKYKKEHGVGWIPCSERMPEEYTSIFAKLKGTVDWNSAMFEKISKDVQVTVEYPDGHRDIKVAHTQDGKWRCDTLRLFPGSKIVAWIPNLEPYMGE